MKKGVKVILALFYLFLVVGCFFTFFHNYSSISGLDVNIFVKIIRVAMPPYLGFYFIFAFLEVVVPMVKELLDSCKSVKERVCKEDNI